MGIREITDRGIRIGQNTDLLFFRVRPVNVAVLPPSVLEAKVAALADVLKSIPSLEILCLNAAESYEDNKQYLLQRMQQEANPVIRRLCEQDIQYLDDIQQEMATARDFYILLRLREGEKQHLERQQLERTLKEQGFEASVASREDVKRMLALYYIQYPVDHTDEIDGGRWLG